MRVDPVVPPAAIPAPKAAGTRVGVISNPASGPPRHAARRQRRMTALLRDVHGVLHYRTDGTDAVAEALAEMAAAGVDWLVVDGGDGTVQTVLSALLQDRVFPQLPVLVVLPHGTANMLADTVGFGPRKSVASESLGRELAHALADPRDARYIERPVLRVEVAGQPLCHGLFFGYGYIHQAVRWWRRHFHAGPVLKRLPNRLAAALTLARLAPELLRRRSPLLHRSHLAGEDLPRRDWQAGLLLATTLNRLILGSRPFWNDDPAAKASQPGAFRYTVMAADAARPWRHFPALFRGRPGPAMTPGNGYLSDAATALELELEQGFVLDGECFDLPRKPTRVRLAAGPALRFLQAG